MWYDTWNPSRPGNGLGVDSITASSTVRSRNQLAKRRRSLGMAANRRRSGFSSGAVASITTTISTFLCTVRQFLLPCGTWLPPGVEAVERAQVDARHRHVLPPFPPGGVARQRLVQSAPSRSNSRTASTYPESIQPLPSHAPLILHRIDSNRFSSIWVRRRPMSNSRKCQTATATPAVGYQTEGLDNQVRNRGRRHV